MTVFWLGNGRRCSSGGPLFLPLFPAVIPAVPPLLFDNSKIARKVLIMNKEID